MASSGVGWDRGGPGFERCRRPSIALSFRTGGFPRYGGGSLSGGAFHECFRLKPAPGMHHPTSATVRATRGHFDFPVLRQVKDLSGSRVCVCARRGSTITFPRELPKNGSRRCVRLWRHPRVRGDVGDVSNILSTAPDRIEGIYRRKPNGGRRPPVVPRILPRHAARLVPIFMHCVEDQGRPPLGPTRKGPNGKAFRRKAYTGIPAARSGPYASTRRRSVSARTRDYPRRGDSHRLRLTKG
jgi:hypothetical protein